VTLTRILLASTAISLSSLGFAHAGPFGQTRSLSHTEAASVQYLSRVQLSIVDAEAALAEAVARQTAAEASGGDIATAQAEVAAAQAELEAAQAAVQGEAAPAVESPAEPEPAPAATDTPATTEEAPMEAGEPAPEPAAEPQAATEPAPEPAAEPEAIPEPAPEQPAADATEQPAAENAPVEVTPEPAPEIKVAPEEPAATEPKSEEVTPSPQPAAETEKALEPTAAEEPAKAETPVPEPKPAAEPEASAPPAEGTPEEPVPGAATEESAPAAPANEPAAKPEPAAEADAPASSDDKASAEPKEEVLILPVEDGAPVLDSAKEEPAPADGTAPAAARSSEPAAPPPASDAEAQSRTLSSEPAPQALSERGERTSTRPEREAQTNVSIINQIDNRTIIQVDNRTVIEHDDRDRLRAGSEEVYYERLSGGRVREVIVRPNGVQLVTITNRWGDVIQRSRVMPDGREYVLFYANANSDGSREAFVDPGRRLPALRLSIPIDEYILDSTGAKPSAFLDFLMEPPVEQVERLYSVEEVRRSARIRDKVRRIDMDSLTFEFGKATIAEDQIQRLSDVADAMTKILERNPAETFLIEGHTDAVGRDDANLLLSDRRAETIAVALSDVFGIPPENLVTQGYGERFLKVRTEAPERLNRRVTIRRITPLVTPVASR